MMKKVLLFLLLSLFLTEGFAQKNVQLNIYHRLGSKAFEMGQTAQNDLKNNFQVSRLEYYMTGFTITHDGGQVTPITDFWVLVDAKDGTTEIDLGDLDITTFEKIKFSIGVGKNVNHNDPASYDASHALAPKSPSMHWGWSPGYRFVAFEGKAGSSLNQTVELHGLGDVNFFSQEHELIPELNGNTIEIGLIADYESALAGINVSSGLIVHAMNAEAQECLENFRDHVFTPAAVTGTDNVEIAHDFDIYPNPTKNNEATIIFNTEGFGYSVAVTNILGEQIANIKNVNGQSEIRIDLPKAGTYFVTLLKGTQPIAVRKLISINQ